MLRGLTFAAFGLFASVASAQATFDLSATSPYFVDPSYVRGGVPIVFSGRMLPADSTGTITFRIDGVGAATVPLSSGSLADYAAVGDSITFAPYIGDPAQRYQNIVGAALNRSVNGYASGGFTACATMLDKVIRNGLGMSLTSKPLFSFQTGGNDINHFGLNNESVFNLCHLAALSWLSVPREAKVLIGDAGVTAPGSWTSAGAFGDCCHNALSTSTPGATARFTLTTHGGPAYLWYLLQSNTPGSFHVVVDGGAPGPDTATSFPAELDTIPGAYAVLRLPVAAGSHTFDVVAESGSVAVFGMGSAAALGAYAPTVLVPDISNPQLTVPPPGFLEYNDLVAGNVALLAADGLDLRQVYTHRYMFGTAAEMVDVGHPNALGLAETAQAYLAALPVARPVLDAPPVASALFTTAALSVGTHRIDAHYSGDSQYPPADAPALGLVVYDPTSSITLDPGGPGAPVGSPITLTASLLPPNATGAVGFFDRTDTGELALGSAFVVPGAAGGTALLALPSLPAGNHTLFARYAGDVFYAGSLSPAAPLTISLDSSSVTLSTPTTRLFAATPITLTANVAPASATGTVVFADGGRVLGQAAVAGGAATLSTAALAPGIHSLTASYGGSSLQSPSQSPVLSVEVDPDSTVISLAPLPLSSPYGTALVLAGAVFPAAATGSLTFADHGTTLGQIAINNGTAAWTASKLLPGTHSFTASYDGDSNDLPSLSSPVTAFIALAGTSVVLGSLPATVPYATPLELSATVAPAAATGSITFTDARLGVVVQVPLRNGSATFRIATFAPGTHTLFASYSGDLLYDASVSATAETRIQPIASALILAPLPGTLLAGAPLQLTATVTPSSAIGGVVFRDSRAGVLGRATLAGGIATLNVPNLSAGPYLLSALYEGDAFDDSATSGSVATEIVLNPTATTLSASASSALIGSSVILTATSTASGGTIVFFDGSAAVGTAPLVGGRATLTLPVRVGGGHFFRADFAADALYAASSSPSVSVTVFGSSTSTTLTLAKNPVFANENVTVNVRVTSGNTIPTGTVVLWAGAAMIATAAISNQGPGVGYATLSIPASALGLGTIALSASYGGDAEDGSSVSSPPNVPVTVQPIPTATALMLSAAQLPVGGSVTLTASVSPNPGGGTITFFSAGRKIATLAMTANGSASYTYAPAAPGSEVLTAAYEPAGLYAGSGSGPQTVSVSPPLLATLDPATTSAAPGSTVTATLTLTPLFGFTGAVQTSCATSAPFVSCSVATPAPITSGAPVSVPVTITLAATSAAVKPSSFAPLLALLLPLVVFRRLRRPAGSLVVTLAIALSVTACAEGGNFLGVPPGTQNVAVTVTAARVAVTPTLRVEVTPWN